MKTTQTDAESCEEHDETKYTPLDKQQQSYGYFMLGIARSLLKYNVLIKFPSLLGRQRITNPSTWSPFSSASHALCCECRFMKIHKSIWEIGGFTRSVACTVQNSYNLNCTHEQNAKNACHTLAHAKIKFCVYLRVLSESVC